MGDFLHLVWGYSWIYKTPTTRTTVMTLPLGNYKPFLKVLKDALRARTFFLSFTADQLRSLSTLHRLAKFTVKAEQST